MNWLLADPARSNCSRAVQSDSAEQEWKSIGFTSFITSRDSPGIRQTK